MINFGDIIREKRERMTRRLMRHRERYVKAWIAETGLLPSECELFETIYPVDGGVEAKVFCIRRATLKCTVKQEKP